MTAAGLLLLTFGLAAGAAWGRPRVTLAILVGVVLTVPSSLSVPGFPPALVTVPRFVELGALLGLARISRRCGGSRLLAAHVVMLPLLAYLAVIAVTGIALADPGISVVSGSYLWIGQAELVLVLALGVALARALPARTVLVTVAAVVLVVDVLGYAELLTGTSWARTVFRAVPAQLGSLPAGPLELRDGALRVRAAGDFALQTGWILTALLPVLACGASASFAGARRRTAVLLLVGIPATLVAVALTRSRTPLAVAAVLIAALTLALGRRRPGVLLAGVAVEVGAALAFGPDLLSRLSPSLDQGSIDVRITRLPAVLALPAAHPLRGIGLSGIEKVALPGLDTSYVLAYVETGAIAAVLLVVLLVFALSSVGRGLRPPLTPEKQSAADGLLVVAAFTGTAVLALSAVTMDTFQAQASNRLTWLLIGFGLAAAERRRGRQSMPTLYAALAPARIVLVGVAIGVGLMVAYVTPNRAATETVFATTSPAEDAQGVFPGSYGRTLVQTTCELAGQVSLQTRWRVSSCGEAGPPGWGRIRIEGSDARTVQRGELAVFGTVHSLRALQGIRVGFNANGTVVAPPTVARVAPWILPLLALCGTALVPRLRPRRAVSRP